LKNPLVNALTKGGDEDAVDHEEEREENQNFLADRKV
jgi:hypothetical protein